MRKRDSNEHFLSFSFFNLIIVYVSKIFYFFGKINFSKIIELTVHSFKHQPLSSFILINNDNNVCYFVNLVSFFKLSFLAES